MGGADYVGMVFMISCAILLSLSQVGGEDVVQREGKISAFVPVLAAVGSSLGFGVRSVLM